MIIGLNGVSGVGKDEVGRILTMKFGARRFALADKVREFALAVDPWVYDPNLRRNPVRLSRLVQEVGWDEAKKNPEVRRLLINIGTEGGRKVVGERVWIKLIEELIRDFRSRKSGQGTPIVITDVRFLNESQWIRDRDGFVVRIERPGYGPLVNHDSEVHDSLLWDYILTNDGTLDDLEAKVVREFGPTMQRHADAPQA